MRRVPSLSAACLLAAVIAVPGLAFARAPQHSAAAVTPHPMPASAEKTEQEKPDKKVPPEAAKGAAEKKTATAESKAATEKKGSPESKSAAEKKPDAAEKKPEGGEKRPAAEPRRGGSDVPSLQEVAKRISEAINEHAPKAAPAVEMTPRPEASKPRAAAVRRPTPPAARPQTLAALKWDASLGAKGVALAWDDQLNPRRQRADLGVRLVWDPAER